MAGNNERFIALATEIRERLQSPVTQQATTALSSLSITAVQITHPIVRDLIQQIRTTADRLLAAIDLIKAFETPVNITTLSIQLTAINTALSELVAPVEALINENAYDPNEAGSDATAQARFTDLQEGIIPQLETMIADVQTKIVAAVPTDRPEPGSDAEEPDRPAIDQS